MITLKKQKTPRHMQEQWGFGLVPEPRHTKQARRRHLQAVARLLRTKGLDHTLKNLDSLSTTKGLFNRTHRFDQWDWFPIWTRLGCPAHDLSKSTGRTLGNLRNALLNNEQGRIEHHIDKLVANGIPRIIDAYLSPDPQPCVPILCLSSSYWDPDLLRIEIVGANPLEHFRNLNADRGKDPLEVRAAWSLVGTSFKAADLVELFKEDQSTEAPGFFEMEFTEAISMIEPALAERPMAA